MKKGYIEGLKMYEMNKKRPYTVHMRVKSISYTLSHM